jgi:DNA-binding MarR family transcriptional regulator
LETALRAEDISPEQWRVLNLLVDRAGHPMNEIAGYAMVPAPTLTKIVDRLIDRALVYRRVDSADRRRVLVFLSDRGADMHELLGRQVELAERELTRTLGEQDASQLAELLGRLLDRVD